MMKDIIVLPGTSIDYMSMKIPIWQICSKRNTEYPGYYRARLFNSQTATPYVIIGKNLDQVRKLMPITSRKIAREKTDNKDIVEHWQVILFRR